MLLFLKCFTCQQHQIGCEHVLSVQGDMIGTRGVRNISGLGCVICAQHNIVPTMPTPARQQPLPDGRFTSLQIDFIGPLPGSRGKTNALMLKGKYNAELPQDEVKLIKATARVYRVAMEEGDGE